MARMRYVKPEYWTDGAIVAMSPWARLFYIGTWNFALCDAGHLPDDALGLKLKILPADPVDGVALLDELIGNGRIARKSMPDGRTYLHILRLADHQKVDARWTPRCPYCVHEASSTDSSTTAEPQPTPPSLSETLESPPKLVTGGDRRGWDRRGEEVHPSDVQTFAQKPRERPTSRADAEFDRFWDAYPRRQAKAAARKAWDKAIKTVDPDRILDAARRYRADPNREEHFTAHAATWLNQGRWDDDALPARASPGTALARVAPRSTTDDRVQAALDLGAQLRTETRP
jgi:hypothetical protein